MNAPATRRFWRIHLSSAVLMMLAAGAVVGVNLRERTLKYNGYFEIGWPETFYESAPRQQYRFMTYLNDHYNEELLDDIIAHAGTRPLAPLGTFQIFFQKVRCWYRVLKPLGINILVGIAILLFVALVNECRIRRRVHA